jgi:hypothetical protein
VSTSIVDDSNSIVDDSTTAVSESSSVYAKDSDVNKTDELKTTGSVFCNLCEDKHPVSKENTISATISFIQNFIVSPLLTLIING